MLWYMDVQQSIEVPDHGRQSLIEDLESLEMRTSEITKLDNFEHKELAESIKISLLKE